MMEIKELMQTFVENKDEYMVENTNYVSDQLSHYQTHNLKGYNCGGYTFKNSPEARTLGEQLSEMNNIYKETSLIDDVKNKLSGRKPTLAEAKVQASSVTTQPEEQQPYMKQEQSKVIAQFQNPFKQIYLWGSQEALDLRALQECISQMESLEERRRKLMKQVSLTEEALVGMRPNVSASTEAMFESAGAQETTDAVEKM